MCIIYIHVKEEEYYSCPGEDSPHLILATASFPEVSDRGELCVNGLPVEPTVVEVHDRFLGILFPAELCDTQERSG